MADEKITLTTLRKQLAQTAHITEQEAGMFLNRFFETIVAGLKEDGQVKVNGLGTFRLQWNAPRKSVNVQTGEDITIEGYNKVTFTPETALKERINEPYAHLESLIIDAEGNHTDTTPAIDPLQKLGEQAEEIKDLLADLIDEDDSTEETLSEEPVSVETTPIVQTATTMPAQEEQPIGSIGSTEPDITETISEEPAPSAETTPTIPSAKQTERPFRPWLVAGITILVFCLLLIGGYFFVQHKIVSWADSLLAEEEPTTLVENEPIVPADTLSHTPIATDSSQTLQEAKPTVEEQTEPLTFTEFIATERLTHGSRLSWLARKYYGTPHFWVYIYCANQDRLPNPNVIPQGTRIRVPKLPAHLGDANNEEHIRKAQALEQEILHR